MALALSRKNRKNVGPRGTTWRGFVITGGGNQKITQSLETVASYGDDPPDFHGAIGVSPSVWSR